MRQLYRSRRNKKLFGLCGGLAEMLNVDANLLRILFIVVAVFTSGAIILIYILAALVIPKEPYYPPHGYGPNGFPPGFGGGYGNYNDRYDAGRDPYRNEGTSGGYGSYKGGPYANPPQPGSEQWKPKQEASDLDAMMDDLEKKALRKEIEELKSKLAKYEKGEF
ncbi:PspC domain-containing protein [Paenibacillus beijingensis]|uniref:Phage-shock protein n=1 Tax=Paenibacillus beijingensis TaxID=1126833 RepID=A0A0D5NFR6_9BACL|nr:PspC domain-containing protein [Paenibacillus beijingensis]AJY73817.1 phage-shock protein [Paenibacillus beijingensis]